MSDPKVSAILITYNAEKNLKKVIKSIKKQSYKNFDLIVIDDASSDKTVSILKNSFNPKKVRLHINNRNYGVGYCRNMGMKMNKNPYVVFFDDDDISNKARIEEQIKILIHYQEKFNTEYIVNFARQKIIYETGYSFSPKSIANLKPITDYAEIIDLCLVNKKNNTNYGSGTPASSLALRIKKTITFDKDLRRGEDLDFAIKLALDHYVFTGTEKVLVNRYMRNENFIFNSWFDSYQILLDKYKAYIEQQDYKFIKKWLVFKLKFSICKTLSIIYLIKLLFNHPKETLLKIIHFGIPRIRHDKNKN